MEALAKAGQNWGAYTVISEGLKANVAVQMSLNKHDPHEHIL